MLFKDFNISSLWAIITGTVLAVVYMFNTFASAEDVKALELQIAYGQYYDRLDDYEEARDEGREELAREYARQMEQIKAVICEEDPEWERCKD